MTDKERKGPFEGLNRKPKSSKGWQEWDRKYALAFLHDQLDRVLPSATKKNYVMSLFNKWEKKFRAELSDEIIYERLGFQEGDITAAVCSELREDQINFITQYIACALCGGMGKDNITRIRHFLEMQTASNIREGMELRFSGGNPLEFFAYVDCLKDIDIADVLFITAFSTMFAYREKRRSWTKSTAKRFLDDLKKDVLFDLPSTVIGAEVDDAIGSNEFEISIEASQCLPPSFIKRFGKTQRRVPTT
jgi:hypothetical protein